MVKKTKKAKTKRVLPDDQPEGVCCCYKCLEAVTFHFGGASNNVPRRQALVLSCLIGKLSEVEFCGSGEWSGSVMRCKYRTASRIAKKGVKKGNKK